MILSVAGISLKKSFLPSKLSMEFSVLFFKSLMNCGILNELSISLFSREEIVFLFEFNLLSKFKSLPFEPASGKLI